ncbi:MAG TPA: hypothetical protein VLO12_12640, partial [Halomonas sp.]|nr:hypothetical protein [Halomonas sp.]
RLVVEPLDAMRFLGRQPVGGGLTGRAQDVADLDHGIPLVTEHDGMGTAAKGRLFTLLIGIHQHLEIGVRQGLQKTELHNDHPDAGCHDEHYIERFMRCYLADPPLPPIMLSEQSAHPPQLRIA